MAFLKTGILLIMLLLLFPVGTAAAPDLKLYEQEVKVGMLYNFLKYTQGSPMEQASSHEVVVCAFGDGALNPYMKSLEGRTVNQKAIVVRYIDAIKDTSTCHLLFVSSGEKSNWPKLKQFLESKNVLTVSDLEGFAHSGGMIEFNKKANRVQVELNIDTVNAAQLRIEERLLKLVTVVHSAPKGGR